MSDEVLFGPIRWFSKEPEDLFLFPKLDYSSWRGYGQFFRILSGFAFRDAGEKGQDVRGPGFDLLDTLCAQITGICSLLQDWKEHPDGSKLPESLPEEKTGWFTEPVILPYEGKDEDHFWGMKQVKGCFLPALSQVWDLSLDSGRKKEPFCGSFVYLTNTLRWYLNSYSYRKNGLGTVELFDQLELEQRQEQAQLEYLRVRTGLLTVSERKPGRKG